MSKKGADSVKTESEAGFVDYNKIKESYNERMERKKKDLLDKFISEAIASAVSVHESFRGSAGIGENIDEEEKAQSEKLTSEKQYELAQAAYQMEMVRYEIAKVKYEKFVKAHEHIDFTLLKFLPEIQEEEYYKQYR